MRIILLGASLLMLAACGQDADTPDQTETPAAETPADGAPAEPDAPASGGDMAAPEGAASPDETQTAAQTDEWGYEEVTEYASVSVSAPRAALPHGEPLYQRTYGDSVAYAREFLDTAQQHAAEAEGEYEFRPYDLSIRWAAPFVTDEVASLVQLTGEYTGGAHPNSGYSTLNWSYEEQDSIDPAELFIDAPGTWEQLSRLAREALIAEKEARLKEAGMGPTPEAMWMDAIEEATAPQAASFENMALVPSTEAGKAGGVRLYYSPYAVGAYAEGAYMTTIPQADFADLVAEDYADLFAGEPAPAETDIAP